MEFHLRVFCKLKSPRKYSRYCYKKRVIFVAEPNLVLEYEPSWKCISENVGDVGVPMFHGNLGTPPKATPPPKK